MEAAPAHPGVERYGEPCRACGYSWSLSYDEALQKVCEAPGRLRELIEGREDAAMQKPDEDTWSPSGYVWHLSDWFRIQGQRIYAIDQDPRYSFVPLKVEPDELGSIFEYDALPPVSGLWALDRAAELFVQAARGADRGRAFTAPKGESWTVGQLIVWVAHEAVHHEMDVRRGLEDLEARAG